MAGLSQIKYAAIAGELRREILEGQLGPGARLSSQVELTERFQVSGLTVQRALNTLVEQGFIRTDGRRGTFVEDHPPHLSRYALIFPSHPADQWGVWNRFWTALVNEAEAVNRLGHPSVQVFYDVEVHEDNASYQQLLQDVFSHRLAGLMFAFPPGPLADTPLFGDPDLPRVAIMGPNPELPGLPVICPDGRSFLDRAVDYLAERGRQRVALLTVQGLCDDQYLGHFQARLEASGMTTRPYWTQVVSQSAEQASRNAAHILMMPIQSPDGQIERPDALIVTDDNLIEHASGGLIAAGVQVPEDVEVVGHCNFPWPPKSALPIQRLGFDARATLRLLMARIDSQRQGRPTPLHTDVPAVFEDEVESENEASPEQFFPINALGASPWSTQHRSTVQT